MLCRYGYDVNDWGSAWTNAITAYGNLSQYAGIGGYAAPLYLLCLRVRACVSACLRVYICIYSGWRP